MIIYKFNEFFNVTNIFLIYTLSDFDFIITFIYTTIKFALYTFKLILSSCDNFIEYFNVPLSTYYFTYFVFHIYNSQPSCNSFFLDPELSHKIHYLF